MNKPSLDLYIKKGYNMKINSSYKSKNNTLSNNKINQINALTKKYKKKEKMKITQIQNYLVII